VRQVRILMIADEVMSALGARVSGSRSITGKSFPTYCAWRRAYFELFTIGRGWNAAAYCPTL